MQTRNAKRQSQKGKARISMRDIRALARQIGRQFDPDQVILFGSYAYGQPQLWSDIDLLVVMDSPLWNREQAAQIAHAIDFHFGLDLIVRRPKQLKERLELGDFFLNDVVTKGKVLYERTDERMGRES